MGTRAPGRQAGGDLGGLEGLAASARAGLVREVEASGAFAAGPGWRAAFAAVPRHLFVPYYYVVGSAGYERLTGTGPDAETRERWLRGAYEDVPLATRLRDGELLSSSSQPSLMALMLAELRVAPGDRVLEVGAGTGYNAALLSYRLGEERVTTVDLDPEITASARRQLARAGYRPAVVTGDGARGVPARAPYDAVVATCRLPSVPSAWLAQCRPGARVLTPLATGLAALTVRDAGHAEGRFLHTPAYFVPLRGAGRTGDGTDPDAPDGVPRPVRENDLFRFLLALTRGTLDPWEAYALWEREGRPARERYGVTVDATVTPDAAVTSSAAGPGGEVGRGTGWAWLDDPEGPYAWPLP